jgi:hypothetical protein
MRLRNCQALNRLAFFIGANVSHQAGSFRNFFPHASVEVKNAIAFCKGLYNRLPKQIGTFFGTTFFLH